MGQGTKIARKQVLFFPLHLQSVRGRTDDLAMKPAFSDQKMLSCDYLKTVTLNRGFEAL